MLKTILNRKKVDPNIAVFTGEKHVKHTELQLFSFNRETCIEKEHYSVEELLGFKDEQLQHWLNIHGIHDSNKITEICNKLDVHNLVIQDILDVNQRTKFQEYKNYWFFTIKSIIPGEDSSIHQEQLSFILGPNFLVSFQEKRRDYFDHIRTRLRDNVGIVRERSSDYLLFLLLESILDNYSKTVNSIEQNIQHLEVSDINKDPSPNTLTIIENYKQEVHLIKKTIIPIKEFVRRIEREKFGLIRETNIKYFYELKDLCLSLIDDCDYLNVKLESSSNLFFSIQGHRMNQVMKILTVVSTIFIPLTFIAGIYGMNFTNMPELNWKWGYFVIWGIMGTVFLVMLGYFKKKKWF